MTSAADSTLETSAVPPLASTFVGRRYLKLVVVLGALMAIGPLTIDTYLPALPQLSAEMHATDSQAQLTITGLLLGLGFGQLIIGPLSDAFGRRRPLLIGLAAHGAMSLLCASARARIRRFAAARSTVASARPTPRSSPEARFVTKPAVETRVLLGTQSVRTQAPPRPSRSTTVTGAPRRAATSAAS